MTTIRAANGNLTPALYLEREVTVKQVSLDDILSPELSPEDTVELLEAAGYKEVKHDLDAEQRH